MLPASVPPSDTLEQLIAKIPDVQKEFAQQIKEKYDVPDPKDKVDLHQWGGLNQEMARAQLEVLLDERVPGDLPRGSEAPPSCSTPPTSAGSRSSVWSGKARARPSRQIEAGVDAVIAQGFDAAGHTGAMGTLPIVPEVASIAGDTPIIAAGGVTTGRHLAAALCLGASGVWTGTLWLASRESDVDMIVKEKLHRRDEPTTRRTGRSASRA